MSRSNIRRIKIVLYARLFYLCTVFSVKYKYIEYLTLDEADRFSPQQREDNLHYRYLGNNRFYTIVFSQSPV